MNERDNSDAARGPARPETLNVEFYEDAEGIIVNKRRAGGPGVFLFLWLIGWTVGCIALAVMVIKDPAIGNFAFAVPFWASWLLVAGFLVWIVFGKETFLLRHDGAFFQRTAFINISSRFVPRAEIQKFCECRSNHTENDQHLWGIEMVTLGKPLRFVYRLPDQERAWLVYQFNRFLSIESPASGQDTSELTASVQNAPTPDTESSDDKSACETLVAERTLAEPPTDSDWSFEDETAAVTFAQRGRFSIAAVAMLLFINAFWNGVVSVFVMLLFGLMPANNNQNNVPQGWEWWGMFVFLIPFEVIGTVMFVALLMALLEPFRRTTWRFEQSQIVYQARWPIFRRTRTWDVAQLDRLELRRSRANDTQRQSFTSSTKALSGQPPFELVFVTDGNVDLCRIVGLTEGEVRWIAHIVFERREKWFGK